MTDYFDWVTVTESFFSNEESGDEKVPTFSGKPVGEEETNEVGASGPVEMLSQYGFLSLPARKDEEGECQAMVSDMAGRKVSFVSKDSRGIGIHGELAEGDVVLWSVGGGLVKLTKTGDVVLFKKGEGSDSDSIIGIDPDHNINLLRDGCVFQMTKEEIKMGIGGSSIIITEDSIELNSDFVGVNGGAVKLGVSPVGLPVIVGPSGIAGQPRPNITG